MQPDIRLKTPAIPVANPADTTVFDDGTDNTRGSENRRVMISAFMNQAGTIFHDVYLQLEDGTYSATPRAGNGAGDVITASTVIHKDYKMLPGRNVLRIHTTTLPTTWEVSARLVPDRALGT